MSKKEEVGFGLRLPVDLKEEAEKAIEILQVDNIGKISLNAYFLDAIRRRTEEILKRQQE